MEIEWTYTNVHRPSTLREWSLIMGRGGYKIEGGASEDLPLQKVGAEKVLAVLKGRGGTNSFVVVLTWELEVLAILMGGTKSFHPLKGGGGTTGITLS